jgi:hypothetical protein
MFGVNLDCTYQLEPYLGQWPIPWGISRLDKWTHVSGRPRSSRGGAWYFKAPMDSFVGYGLYQPYVEFLFKGTVERTRRRDDIPSDGAGFRVGDHTWLYFRGQFRSTPRWQLEKELSIRCRIDLDRGEDESLLSSPNSQGHLTIRRYPDGEVPSTIRLVERISTSFRLSDVFPHRRRIFNHQFFGPKVRVYYLPYLPEVHGETAYPEQLQWVVWVPKEANVVSPDHLDQPCGLDRGLYWATHPRPGVGVD